MVKLEKIIQYLQLGMFMDKNKIIIKNINDVYNAYSYMIGNQELCNNNQEMLSIFAFQIDSYALTTIINFFNKYTYLNEKCWQSSLLIIRMMSIVASELIRFIINKGLFRLENGEDFSNIEDIISLRNKIHQFRYQDFEKSISKIDNSMGRSRDVFNPHLDINLIYKITGQNSTIIGTNIYYFRFDEAKKQSVIDTMQKIVRIIEELSGFPVANFEIIKNDEIPKYKWSPYCYTDISKHAKIQNEKLLDRVLLAFDDLCTVNEFFQSTIKTSEYLKEAPYLIYYFIKMISIVLDETFDNLYNYINWNSKSRDAELIQYILEDVDFELIDYCKKIRNNLHYEHQENILIENEYGIMQKELAVVNVLIEKIRFILNITPSKIRLNFYGFLKWLGSPI